MGNEITIFFTFGTDRIGNWI